MSLGQRTDDSKTLTKNQSWDLFRKIRDGWIIAHASIGVWINEWFDGDGPHATAIAECLEDPYQWLAEKLGVKKASIYRLRQFGRLVMVLGDEARKYEWMLSRDGRPLLREWAIRPLAKLLPHASKPVTDDVAQDIVDVFHELAEDAEAHAKAEGWKKPSINQKSAKRIVKARQPDAKHTTVSRSAKEPDVAPNDRPLDIKASTPDDVFPDYLPATGGVPVAPVVHGSAIQQQKQEIAACAFDLLTMVEAHSVSSPELMACVQQAHDLAKQEAEACPSYIETTS